MSKVFKSVLAHSKHSINVRYYYYYQHHRGASCSYTALEAPEESETVLVSSCFVFPTALLPLELFYLVV